MLQVIFPINAEREKRRANGSPPDHCVTAVPESAVQWPANRLPWFFPWRIASSRLYRQTPGPGANKRGRAFLAEP